METKYQKVITAISNIAQKYLMTLKAQALTQIKRYVVTRKIKEIPKLNDTISEFQTNSSGKQSHTNYETIKPMQDRYTSIKILSTQGFNKSEEDKIFGSHRDFDEDNQKLQKGDYFQKYLNQTQKQTFSVQNSPQSEYCSKNLQEYNPLALQNINKCKYTDYFDQVIVSKSDWKRQQVQRMKYSDSLGTPLTRLQQIHHQMSESIFKMLLKFEGVNIQFSQCVIAAQIVNKINKLSQQLKQEAYLQVIKQMNGPRFKMFIRLLALFAATVKVPLRFYLPLLNYCLTNLSKSPTYFTYIFYLLIKNFQNPRKVGTLPFQAQMIMYMKKIAVVIDLPTQKVFYFECTATVENVLEQICTYFELDKNLQYLINYKNGYIQTGNFFDGLFQIDSRKTFNQREVYHQFYGFKVIPIFKDMTCAFDSILNLNLLYVLQRKKYLTGIYSLKKTQIIDLASLKYYSENDSLGLAELLVYVPRKHIQYFGQSYWANQLAARIKKISCTKRQARKQFLRILRRKDCFMAHIFQAKLYMSGLQQIILKVLLFISPGLIHFLGTTDSPVYKRIRMNEIKQWGKSRSEICLKYRSQKLQKIAHLQCQSQRIVNSIFQNYTKTLEKYVNDNKQQDLDRQI